MGPGVSQESGETQDGLHVWEDHFLPEVVDPVTLEVLPDGEEGELVFTSLTKQAMPVIRYRTRDLTRLLPGTAYPVVPADGQGHRPHRRPDDRARGQRLPQPGRGADPHDRGALAALPLRADPAGQPRRAHGAGRGGGRARRRRWRSSARLAERVKNRIGVTARVEVLPPGALERSLGKARRISDQR